ncbi:MAG: LuxR C-terminal-related transcriptional regulator [Rhizobiaceae bacterium]
MRKQVHERARCWDSDLPGATQTAVPQLLRSDPDIVSDAFPVAREPLANRKRPALCVFEKVGPGFANTVIAANMPNVLPVIKRLAFQSLAGPLFDRHKSAMCGQPSFSPSIGRKERVARGKTGLEVARITNLSEHTINHSLANSLTKLNASNRVYAAAYRSGCRAKTHRNSDSIAAIQLASARYRASTAIRLQHHPL